MHLVFRQARVLGDTLYDQLVVDDVKPELLGKPGSDFRAERADFAGMFPLRPAPFASDRPIL